jgi:DNA (cytosine-5)-methyltransferase 1
MTSAITSGHLCSGYDGLGRGLSLLAPHVTLWHAESDEDMAATLAKHEPDVPNAGDLTAAPWHLAPRPTVVTAGIPCQPISVAGRGDGEDDERYLWPYAAEIFRIVRPPFILLENVQRLTSMKLNDGTPMLGKWLADLRDLRYAVTWTVIGACAVGAPHHRHRFYAWCRHVPAGPVPEARRVHTPCGAPRSGGRILLPTPMARDGDGRGEGDELYWAHRRGSGRANGLPLGAVIGLLPTPMTSDANGPGRATKTGGDDLRTTVSLLPTPTTSNSHGNDRNGRGELLLPGIAARLEVWGRYAEAVALWESIIGRPAPEPTEPNESGGRRMSPLLPEWMMGLPAGLLTGHLPRNAAIKAAGNGAVPLQAAAAQKLLAAPQ